MTSATHTLLIGSRNFSSWSLRGWLAMKLTGSPFETKLFNFHTPERAQIASASPSGLVPAAPDAAGQGYLFQVHNGPVLYSRGGSAKTARSSDEFSARAAPERAACRRKCIRVLPSCAEPARWT